jgi:hypothetical protein
MPDPYQCDQCDVTAATLDGWILVQILFLHENPEAPVPPGGRTLDATAPDLRFHTAACRDAWCATAGVTVPTPTAAP